MNNLLSLRDLEIEVNPSKSIYVPKLDLGSARSIVIAGQNGAGKSSVARCIAGFGSPKLLNGQIFWKSQNISQYSLEERANLGIFYAFQEPVEISGLSYREMLREVLRKRSSAFNEMDFKLKLAKSLEKLELNAFMAEKYIGDNLSGGEKKKMEILQILMLEPKLAILDEIDSGLDEKSAALISKILAELQQRKKLSMIIITHNQRILEHLDITSRYKFRGNTLELDNK